MIICSKRQIICKKDVQGTLFIPPGEGPFPAIINIHGGMKRKQLVEDAAEMFANNGFVSMALAFFAYGLPKVYTVEPVRFEIFVMLQSNYRHMIL